MVINKRDAQPDWAVGHEAWIDAFRSEDLTAAEALLDRAFGPDRHQKISYRYRDGIDPVASLGFVARCHGGIVGTIRFWPVAIGPRPHAALLLGPLAVSLEHQRAGLGGRLMQRGLDAARAEGHRIVLLVGDPDYYGRFGFAPAADHGIFMPGEAAHRVRVLALIPRALDGVAGMVRRALGRASDEPPTAGFDLR